MALLITFGPAIRMADRNRFAWVSCRRSWIASMFPNR